MSTTRPAPQQPPYPPPPPPPQQPPYLNNYSDPTILPRTQTRHELDLTIISAKHLKNVNWKTGSLKPYAIFWVDPDNKLTTKSDDCSDTKPVWNQRFTLPITNSVLSDVVLTIEIFHSKASETPKPYVGSAHIRLSGLSEPDDVNLIRVFDLIRPSGRVQGKIRLKIGLKEINYQNTPANFGYYYENATPYGFSVSRSASPAPPPSLPPYIGYYAGYYSPAPPPPPATVMRSFSERNISHGAPSAPVDYSPYEPRYRAAPGNGLGLGTGIGIGAVAGALGGLALDKRSEYEPDDVITDRVADNYVGSSSVKDDFSEYHADY